MGDSTVGKVESSSNGICVILIGGVLAFMFLTVGFLVPSPSNGLEDVPLENEGKIRYIVTNLK